MPIMLSCLISITDLLQRNSNSLYRMRGKWKVRNVGKSLQRKPRWKPVVTLFFRPSTLNYSPIATQLTPLVTHECKMRIMYFEENGSDGSQNTTEKVLCSPSRVPLIIHRSQPNLCLL